MHARRRQNHRSRRSSPSPTASGRDPWRSPRPTRNTPTSAQRTSAGSHRAPKGCSGPQRTSCTSDGRPPTRQELTIPAATAQPDQSPPAEPQTSPAHPTPPPSTHAATTHNQPTMQRGQAPSPQARASVVGVPSDATDLCPRAACPGTRATPHSMTTLSAQLVSRRAGWMRARYRANQTQERCFRELLVMTLRDAPGGRAVRAIERDPSAPQRRDDPRPRRAAISSGEGRFSAASIAKLSPAGSVARGRE